MKANSSISVIIPIYNAAKRLDVTLESLTKQTYAPLEIILVDDGSTDESGQLADAFASVRSHTQVLHTPNHGAYAAREAGLNMATGKYVTFCDAGDTLHEQAINEMMNKAKSTGADIVAAAFNRIINGKTQTEMTGFGNAVYAVDKCSGYLVSVNTSLWAKLFRRSTLDKRIHLHCAPNIGEDALLLYSLYPYVTRIAFIDSPLYNYIVEDDSAMSSMEIQDFDTMLYAWLEVRARTSRIQSDYELIIDLAALMHLGVAAPLAMECSQHASYAQVRMCAQLAKASLDESFPGYRNSPFLSREYVRQYPTMRKIALMHALVSWSMVPAAVRCLNAMKSTLGINIGW